MPVNQYKLTAPKLAGHLLVEYEEGNLASVQVRAEMHMQMWNNIRKYLPYHEQELNQTPWTISVQEKPTAPNEMIAMFCDYYKRHMGTRYKATPREIGMIKRAEVTHDLLEAWFTSKEWWAKTKTMGRYCRHLPELRESINAVRSPFPNEYDRDLERRLQPGEVQAYWAHLRSLGFRPHKVQGKTVDWKRPQPEQT